MFKTILMNEKKNRTISIVITVAYFAFNLFLVFRHEAWRDESQAWTMAKNLSLIELFRALPTEGHPCLWFVFIMPFAKIGLSFYYFSLISLTVMTVSLYLFLEFCPFSLLVKIAVLFSSIFLYFNPVVSRIYSLIALIVVLLAVFYKDRISRPVLYGVLVGLLLQTHVVVFGLAIGLSIDLFIEYLKNRRNKRLFVSLGIILFSFACMVWEIMPRSSAPSGIDTSTGGILKKLNITFLGDKLSNFAYTTWGIPEGPLSLFVYILLLIPITLIFIFITKNKRWKENYQIIISAVCGVGVFFGILILVYTSHTQMSSILTMIILFVLWQLYNQNKENNLRLICITLVILLSILSFIVPQSIMRQDVSGFFSDSKFVADVIEHTIPENGVLIVENNVNDSPVYSYAASRRKDIEFYDAFNDDEFVFHRMGIEYKNIGLNDVIDKAKQFDTAVYYLTYSEITDDKLQLVCTTKNFDSIWNENYYLYEIRGVNK